MAIDTAAKRASALATFTHPYLRLVVPDGSTDRAAAGGLYNGFAVAPDVTAPTVSSWTIAADGLSSSIVFSEAVTRGTDGITGLVLTPTNGGAAITLSYTSGDGTNTLVIGHNRAVSSTETLTRSYTQPGDGIKDTAAPANVLASFSATAVTPNDSTVNAAPSDIYASNNTISVNAADGAQLCVMTAVDADPGETFTWAEVAGTGDTNNAAVVVASNGVVTVVSPATLGVGSYTYRAQVTDSAANTRAEAFAFSVVDSGGGDGAFSGLSRLSAFRRFR